MDNSGSEVISTNKNINQFIFLHEFFRDPRKNRKLPLAELAPTSVFTELFDPTFRLIQVPFTNLKPKQPELH